jgi:hypothetical protein
MEEKEYFVRKAQSNETFGPISAQEVRDGIRKTHIGKLDHVCKSGDEKWLPISISDFQEDIKNQIALEQMSASTCPNCNAGMVVLVGNDKLGLWLIIIGVVLTPIVCGIPLWVWGMMRFHGRKGKSYYQCPRCKFTTR